MKRDRKKKEQRERKKKERERRKNKEKKERATLKRHARKKAGIFAGMQLEVEEVGCCV